MFIFSIFVICHIVGVVSACVRIRRSVVRGRGEGVVRVGWVSVPGLGWFGLVGWCQCGRGLPFPISSVRFDLQCVVPCDPTFSIHFFVIPPVRTILVHDKRRHVFLLRVQLFELSASNLIMLASCALFELDNSSV